MSELLAVSALTLMFSLFLGLLRVLRGPGPGDRMLAAQLIGTSGVGMLLLLGVLLEQAGRAEQAREAMEKAWQLRSKLGNRDRLVLEAIRAEGAPAREAAIAAEVEHMYHACSIGTVDDLTENYYAISPERKLKHPAVVRITEVARSRLLS